MHAQGTRNTARGASKRPRLATPGAVAASPLHITAPAREPALSAAPVLGLASVEGSGLSLTCSFTKLKPTLIIVA